MSKKSILIITDGTESINQIARSIESLLTKFNVNTITAKDFTGTEILPAEIFFLGCEDPNPVCFSYLEKMLLHINFAGRKCGIFSVNQNTLKYLRNILKHCDTALSEPFLAAKGNIDNSKIQKWLKDVI